MINRNNWKSVKDYLDYRDKVDQVSVGTLELDASLLRHLLEWADETSFREAPTIQPRLTDYLEQARLDGRDKPLSKAYATKIVGAAKRFFKWLRANRRGYSAITPTWLASLKPPRTSTEQQHFKAVTFEEIKHMAQAPAVELWEQRIRAAAIFMFLSGIRVSAFASLPLSAVDLKSRTVKQWPSLGVRTKFSKRATTYLLDIPALNGVIEEWDRLVRSELPEDGFWFAPFNTLEGGFDKEVNSIGRYRHVRVRKDLQRWLDNVNLPYRAPHQFRHGHAVYALKQAQDVADLKAVSMNLMHSNLSITDGVYGIMSQQDISKRIQGLGKPAGSQNPSDTYALQAQLARMEQLLLVAISRSSLEQDSSVLEDVTIPNYLLDQPSDGQLPHPLARLKDSVEPYPDCYDQEGAGG
jgi:site-specific recombinase XerC